MNFFVNNSSFSYLSCTLRYKRLVVDGARRTKTSKPELLGGLLFHDLMARISEKQDGMYFSVIEKPKHADKVKPELVPKYIQLADKIFQEHPDWFKDCRREQVCTYHFTTVEHNGKSIDVSLSFTPDLMYYDEALNCVVIRDYKTTSKPINGQFFIDYALKSQPLFYQLALIWGAIQESNPLNLPPHWIKAIIEERLMFGYVFVNCAGAESTYVVQPPRFVNTLLLKSFQRVLSEKIHLAAALHLDPSLAIKEGIFLGTCTYCEFQSICSMNDEEREEKAYKSWPLGFKPYDPNHKDNE